jgi:hypothetical protein
MNKNIKEGFNGYLNEANEALQRAYILADSEDDYHRMVWVGSVIDKLDALRHVEMITKEVKA